MGLTMVRRHRPKLRRVPDALARAEALAGKARVAAAGDEWEVAGPAVRMLDGDQLGLMLSRRIVTLAQFGWGERLRRDWYLAGFAASGIVDLTRPVVDRTPDYEAAMVAADEHKRRFGLALRAVGMVHSMPLVDVVCGDVRLVDYGRRRCGYGGEKQAFAAAAAVTVAALNQLGGYYEGKRKGE